MISDDAGKVATTAIEALKGSPSCLAAILFACIMAVLTYLSLRNEQAEMHQRQMLMLDRCFPLHEDKDYHPPRSEP